MRNLFGINLDINQAYNDMKMMRDMEAGHSFQGYTKYATTKKASLKRKKKSKGKGK